MIKYVLLNYMLLIIYYIYAPVQSSCEQFNSSGPKLLNRWFNQFLAVGPVNQWPYWFDVWSGPNNYGLAMGIKVENSIPHVHTKMV